MRFGLCFENKVVCVVVSFTASPWAQINVTCADLAVGDSRAEPRVANQLVSAVY